MKEKKLLILLLLWLIGTGSLMAQRLGGGLMLGPTFSTMSMSGNDSTRFRPDFTGGVRIALIPKHSIVGAEIDVLYSRQGTSSKKGLDANNNTIRYLEKSHYINVPLLLNIYFRKWNEDDEDESMIPRLRIGPQVGFCIGGNDVTDLKIKKKRQQYITSMGVGQFQPHRLWHYGCLELLVHRSALHLRHGQCLQGRREIHQPCDFGHLVGYLVGITKKTIHLQF